MVGSCSSGVDPIRLLASSAASTRVAAERTYRHRTSRLLHCAAQFYSCQLDFYRGVLRSVRAIVLAPAPHRDGAGAVVLFVLLYARTGAAGQGAFPTGVFMQMRMSTDDPKLSIELSRRD